MSKFIIGLTGGIGSGKTAVSDCFAHLGIAIIDADICARDAVAKNSKALIKIVEHFGEGILTQEGELDRAKLRDIVFTQPAEKDWLNSLLHPIIRQLMLDQIAKADTEYCILAVPLLLENKMQSMVNRVLVVDVSPEVQVKRVISRDNSDENVIRAIMSAQIDREQRLNFADDVINNEADLSALKSQVNSLHQKYLSLASENS